MGVNLEGFMTHENCGALFFLEYVRWPYSLCASHSTGPFPFLVMNPLRVRSLFLYEDNSWCGNEVLEGFYYTAVWEAV